MTRFLDGPAQGQVLMLKRACRFLRVTAVVAPESGKASKWDALDQLTDTPNPDETLFAYEMEGACGHAIVCASGGRGGVYSMANFKYVAEQPSQEQMRDPKAWHDWCVAKADQV